MKCNHLTWCERYFVSLKNPAHVGAKAGDEVETVDAVLNPQQPPAVPLGDMNSETVDGAQESDPPPPDKTDGQLGDD